MIPIVRPRMSIPSIPSRAFHRPARRTIGASDLVTEHDHGPHHMLGDRLGIGIGGENDGDPQLGARFHWDVVEPHPVASDPR